MSASGDPDPENLAGTLGDALQLVRPLGRFVAEGLVCAWHLALARGDLASLTMHDIACRNERAAKRGRDPSPERTGDAQQVRRIAVRMPRVARRLPFRSDCLIRALAAQRWLARHGIATRIAIGVDTDALAGFSSHAWLLYGDKVVTGGDVSRYQLIFANGNPAALTAQAGFTPDK